jgi:hypothetical protein
MKTYETFNSDNDLRYIYLHLWITLSDYFNTESDELFKFPNNVKIFNIDGYSVYINRDDGDPGDDYENEKELFKYIMIVKDDIDVVQLKLSYTEGTLGLDKVIHRQYYYDLIMENWKIASDFLWEKFKNNIINIKSKNFNL